MRWLWLLMVMAGCEARRSPGIAAEGALDSRLARRWRYAFQDSTGETRRVQVGSGWLAIHLSPRSDREVLADFLALDADVVTECASTGGECAGDCLFLIGSFEPTLHFSELDPEGALEHRWSNAQPYVEFELRGFEVLTPFRAHVWTGRDLDAHWAHGELTTLEAKHFPGREVNPGFYRRAR
jgi:hypothetical protein